MCSQVLEFAKTQIQRTFDDAVEILLRDRKGTVRGIADDTDRTYRERLGAFTAWAAGRGLQHIDEVNADVIDSFFIHLRDERRNSRTGAPLSDSTVRDFFLSLRAFFNALHRRGTISSSPIDHKRSADFPEPEIERFTPTDTQMARALTLFDSNALYGETDLGERKITFLRARNRAILCLMADCGLRSYEVRNLEAAGIDWDYSTARFAAKGRRRGREAKRVDMMPFGPTTRRALLAYKTQRDALRSNAKQFFLTFDGRAMSKAVLRTLFATVARAAKLPGLTPHAVRRFAITGVVKDHGLRHGQLSPQIPGGA